MDRLCPVEPSFGAEQCWIDSQRDRLFQSQELSNVAAWRVHLLAHLLEASSVYYWDNLPAASQPLSGDNRSRGGRVWTCSCQERFFQACFSSHLSQVESAWASELWSARFVRATITRRRITRRTEPRDRYPNAPGGPEQVGWAVSKAGLLVLVVTARATHRGYHAPSSNTSRTSPASALPRSARR